MIFSKLGHQHNRKILVVITRISDDLVNDEGLGMIDVTLRAYFSYLNLNLY